MVYNSAIPIEVPGGAGNTPGVASSVRSTGMRPKLTPGLLSVRHRSSDYPSGASAVDRFWRWVDKRGPDECWPWTGAHNGIGYGTINISRHMFLATHVAVVIDGRSIDAGSDVCHTCDNPTCCNPAHLFVGTREDNMRDARKKGRLATGDRHPSRVHKDRLARGDRNGAHTHPERRAFGDRNGARKYPERIRRGESHPFAKLSSEQVASIRAEVAGGATHSSVAARYGVGRSTVSYIVARKNWRQEEQEPDGLVSVP